MSHLAPIGTWLLYSLFGHDRYTTTVFLPIDQLQLNHVDTAVAIAVDLALDVDIDVAVTLQQSRW